MKASEEGTDTIGPVDIPWSELTAQIAQILVENALERAADKGIKLDRAALETAARTRAAQLVIYNWFTEGFDTADLKEAKALLDELTA